MSGKKYRELLGKFDPLKPVSVKEACKIVGLVKVARFDESIDLSIRLGVDPKRSDQVVRGAVSLPFGLGKVVRILVLAKGEKDKEARDAGADYVGAEDMVEKILGGWTDFDKMIATPDLMILVGKLGKVLGPRGLMPNPKDGTVTFDVGRAVKENKAGKVSFRTDKAGIVHASVGKYSFDPAQLEANAKVLIEDLVRLKPQTAKGVYLKSISLSTTMGPAVKIDPLLL